MADRDQHPSREDEIRHAVFGQVDLQTAEPEIVSSIYDGFAAAILVKGQPRTIALTREYSDAVQLMAMIERSRPAHPAASEASAAAGDPKGRRSIYDAAYDSIRKGAPGLSDATCVAIARSINLKVANGSASAEPGAIDEDWIRGLISEAVVMAEDQEREDESDEEICRISENVLNTLRPYLRAQPQSCEGAQPVRGEIRVIDGNRCRFIERELEGDKWEVIGPATHPAPDTLRVAISDIAAERQRQVDVEGWSESHDDEHDDYQMARAAGCYAFHAGRVDDDDAGMFVNAAVRHGWPWDRAWWKPKSRRADLVRAGALIVAEIERLDRAALQAEQGAK